MSKKKYRVANHKKNSKHLQSKKDLSETSFLITGGSGSLGRNIIKRLLEIGARNIVSISRDENVIKEAEHEIGSPFVKFKIGDITDKEFIVQTMKGVDIVFHTAAIKHVSMAEQNPRETYRVNIVGLLNILNSSADIKKFIHVSSDKAIGVMNCYGATKLLGEYLVKESNSLYHNNAYIITRCPNLLGSRGSVLDVWNRQLAKDNVITLSDPDMTRYFITLSDAASFLVDIALNDNTDNNVIHYPLTTTKKFRVKDLAEAFIKTHGNSQSKIKITGALPGEKKHEDYISDVPLLPARELSKILSGQILKKNH
ncbi:MAG: SDR family NAD(P)-dependent oxidoreductase [Nanoarchaeota archaeon]